LILFIQSGTIYNADKEHVDLLCEAYKLFVHSNPLHNFTFPATCKMESEIISMTKYMLNGNEKTCGAITSGGTESILMACKKI
jgi:sphinganine-1-phosphate aldolase